MVGTVRVLRAGEKPLTFDTDQPSTVAPVREKVEQALAARGLVVTESGEVLNSIDEVLSAQSEVQIVPQYVGG